MTSSAVMARQRLADIPPAFCNGCACGADTRLRYVEFVLPVLKVELVSDGEQFIDDDIDDLALCETCIHQAAVRVGLRRDPRLDTELRDLIAARDAANARVDDALREQNELRDRITNEFGVAA